jgi:hypothetical protein
LTDFDEILYVYSVGLRIGCYLFFIPLCDKGRPPQVFLFLFFGQNCLFLFFYDVALKNTYNPKFSSFYHQPLFFNNGTISNSIILNPGR